MIPAWHRQKAGGPQLGARQPGERGPFGPYGADEDRVGEDDLEDGQAAEPPSPIGGTDH